MLRRTPSDAIVTSPKSLFNSSSFFTVKVICLGAILDFLLSRAATLASSIIQRKGIQALLRGILVLFLQHEFRTSYHGGNGGYDLQGTAILPWQIKWWTSFLHDLPFLFLFRKCYKNTVTDLRLKSPWVSTKLAVYFQFKIFFFSLPVPSNSFA